MRLVFSFLAMVLLVACGKPEQEPASTAPAAASSPPEIQRTASTIDARVFFISPTDGSTHDSPVAVEFGMDGMAVVPAGDMTPASGHHHILIDTGLPDLNLPIPNDQRHVHFGDGSSATELELAPGEHTLQLLFADHLHIPHDPPVYSEQITITVR